MTIQSDIDAMSKGLKEHAQQQGYWNPQRDGEFNFSDAFADGSGYNHRQISGKFLLKKHKGMLWHNSSSFVVKMRAMAPVQCPIRIIITDPTNG